MRITCADVMASAVGMSNPLCVRECKSTIKTHKSEPWQRFLNDSAVCDCVVIVFFLTQYTCATPDNGCRQGETQAVVRPTVSLRLAGGYCHTQASEDKI